MRPEQAVSRILCRMRVAPQPVTIIHLGSTVARRLQRPTRELGRAALKRSPIWSCTGWGLPSFPGHPGNWCALTAPFHPCSGMQTPKGVRLPGRSAFCCTFLRVAATPRYGAPCPSVFGLSSRPVGTGDRLSCSDRRLVVYLLDSVPCRASSTTGSGASFQ